MVVIGVVGGLALSLVLMESICGKILEGVALFISVYYV